MLLFKKVVHKLKYEQDEYRISYLIKHRESELSAK